MVLNDSKKRDRSRLDWLFAHQSTYFTNYSTRTLLYPPKYLLAPLWYLLHPSSLAIAVGNTSPCRKRPSSLLPILLEGMKAGVSGSNPPVEAMTPKGSSTEKWQSQPLTSTCAHPGLYRTRVLRVDHSSSVCGLLARMVTYSAGAVLLIFCDLRILHVIGSGVFGDGERELQAQQLISR